VFYEFDGKKPVIGDDTYVSETALLIGDVRIGGYCYIGHGVILRGDYGTIDIGNGVTVEEGVIVHAPPGECCSINEGVVIGHGAIVHAKSVGENAGIGMGAILSVRSEIGQETVVAEGAVVKQGQSVPASIVVAGNPAKKTRDISAKDRDFWAYSRKVYRDLAQKYLSKGMHALSLPEITKDIEGSAMGSEKLTSDETKDQNGSIFDARAAAWDEDPFKVKLANDVSDAIIREITPTQDMNVLDYGCGSGLVTLRLQPLVKSITGMDSSGGMLEAFRSKVEKQNLKNVHIRFMDLEKFTEVNDMFNLIVSSMTLHHIKEPDRLLKRFYDLLLPGGRIGIADLDREDGAFHKDNIGVIHFGFERTQLKELLVNAGFGNVRDITAAKVTKVDKENNRREFSVFLMIAVKE
jgi:carbonic anhydrase/acetyltransferase-like protein (isoleucine patch superfamily)/ubiquinone/menaquinone biosynthesis C-methylase UbiE